MLENCPVCGWRPVNRELCPNCDSDLGPVIRALEDLSQTQFLERQRRAKSRRLMIVLPTLAFIAGISLMAVMRPGPPEHKLSFSPPPSPAAAGPVVTGYKPVPYTVRPGDSLWLIARRAYGNGALWPKLVEQNPGLAMRRLLRAGERIELHPITIAPRGVR